jgi:predicted ester cyclase
VKAATPEAVARRLIDEGFSQGRMAVVDELVSPRMKEHQVRGPAHPAGSEGVKAVINTLRTAFEDFRLSIQALSVDGEVVWTRNRATGIHRAAFAGMQATGRWISIEVFDVMRDSDGLIVEHWGLPDHMTLLAQLRGS